MTNDVSDSEGAGHLPARRAGRADGTWLAPERIECAIENRNLLRPVNDERTARVIDLVSRRQIDVGQRVDHVEHPAGMDVDAPAPQHTAEHDQIIEKLR